MSDLDPLTVAQHRDHFRGRCALALDANSKITYTLANAIRISPMRGCVDLGAITACRTHISVLLAFLDKAEESARAVQAGEADSAGNRGTDRGSDG